MAKPIPATPVLGKDDSLRLIENMIKNERRKKPTKIEQFYIDAIRANWGPKKR